MHERVEARYLAGRHCLGLKHAYRTIEEAYDNSGDHNPESLGIFDTYEEAKAFFDFQVKKCSSASVYTSYYGGIRIAGDVYFIEEGEYEYDEDYEEWECIDCPETVDYFASSLPEEEEEDEEEEDEEDEEEEYLFKAPTISEQPNPVEDSSPRSYKEFAKKSIGGSDIASLLFRPCFGDPFVVRFGCDGEYSAYICEGDNVVIGAHYQKVGEGAGWLRVYDDDGLPFESRSDFPAFTVYRAGEMGCIIHFHSKEEEED